MSGIEEINKLKEVRRINSELVRINNHNISENHTLRRFLTIKQLATILGDDDNPIDETTIRNYCRPAYEIAHGYKLERYKFGGKIIFLDEDVIDFIEKCSGRKPPRSI